MKLIIDVPEDIYRDAKILILDDFPVIKKAIINSTPYKERPQGEWIEHYSKELSDKGFYLCSRCKTGFQRYERGVRHSDLPWIDGQKYELHCIDNFCPNCGADMRVKQIKG